MNATLRLATGSLLLFAALDVRSDEGHGEPGLWEITAQVEIPGQQAALPPSTETECLSQADLDAEPATTLDRGACRATDVQRSGNKVTWTITCDSPVSGKGKGEIAYRSSTEYAGAVTMEIAGTTVRTTVKAKRVGACTQGADSKHPG